MSGPDFTTSLDAGVVAVLRASSADRYAPVCAVLTEAGVTALELTLTTPGTIGQLSRLREANPRACIGVGTVLTAEQAREAIDRWRAVPRHSRHVPQRRGNRSFSGSSCRDGCLDGD